MCRPVFFFQIHRTKDVKEIWSAHLEKLTNYTIFMYAYKSEITTDENS